MAVMAWQYAQVICMYILYWDREWIEQIYSSEMDTNAIANTIMTDTT